MSIQEEDIRAADQSFKDQLIGDYEPEFTEDDEINQAIRASLESAKDDLLKKNKQIKYENEIKRLTKLEQERIDLENYRIQKQREEKISERELELRNIIVFLTRFKLEILLKIIQDYIQNGKKINYEYYDMFKNELKPSEFDKIEYIFNIPYYDNELSDSEYEYEPNKLPED